mmetsp:Transcript_38590/g.100049  ORF Transcript_38590/g.100049 Transcript_38590/m.100049 type:complete len:166 (-) Transcript_38590:373-870(-)
MRALLTADVEEDLRLPRRLGSRPLGGKRVAPVGMSGGLKHALHAKPCPDQATEVSVDWSVHSTPVWQPTSVVSELPLSLLRSGRHSEPGRGNENSLHGDAAESDATVARTEAPSLGIAGGESCRVAGPSENTDESPMLVLSLTVRRVDTSSSRPCAYGPGPLLSL